MRIRPYEEADLSELLALWNEAQVGSYEFIPYTALRLREELEEAHTVLIAADEEGNLLGLTFLRREWYGEELLILSRPGPKQWEVEERLLVEIEPRTQTGKLTAVVDATDRKHTEFFTAHGYKPEGSLYQMFIELDRPWLKATAPPGYCLRSLQPDEEDALIRVVNAAYEGERLHPGALARWEQESPGFGPEWVQVAECAGELVAAVVSRPDTAFNEHYGANRAYLGPAATLPAHRGKGLCKALTVQALAFLWERGLKAASLYTWSGNTPVLCLLKGLGFQEGREWRLLTKAIAVKRGR